mmetsp:Transcript_40551/g.53376  ORF Transcript_40551/g.53376 Transcript_40551/m.53376 type:complete len:315 (+) Transcript_40551:71-1015(+)
MVFFVCDGCNETLKRNQVDTHAGRCRNCYAVTCVDCNVSFPDNDYKQHLTCISEAEKYEGSLYQAPKKKTGKVNPQEAWMDLIAQAANNPSPPGLQNHLQRMAELGNVPRARKKFDNFLKNSLRLHNDSVLSQLWEHLDQLRKKEKEVQEKQTAGEKKEGSHDQEQKNSKTEEVPLSPTSKAEKKSKKKKKKRKLKENEQSDDKANQKKIKTCVDDANTQPHFDKAEQLNGNSETAALKEIKWKKLIKCALKEAPNHTLKKAKLQKKIQRELKSSDLKVAKKLIKTQIDKKLQKMSKVVSIDDKKNCIMLIEVG